MKPTALSRRVFTAQFLRAGAAMLVAPPLVRVVSAAPAIFFGGRPVISHGVASGEVSFDSAVIWSRADRPARMLAEWSTTESFQNLHRVTGPIASAASDFTAKVELARLPPGQRIFYRVRFEDRAGGRAVSEPVTGQLVTASRDARDVFFAWSGDTCGQGYGIDLSRGGLRTYESMRQLRPDFFIHSGDTIYADVPLEKEMKLPDGSGEWRNLVTEEKSKVAETLAEFRGNHRYNLLDENVRACNATVPVFAQWDDHELRNNWYPGQNLRDDPRYTVKNVDVLARRARQAFFEYWPLRGGPRSRIYRRISRGPLCEIFFLDLRTYRGPNTLNRQPRRSRETDFLGGPQLEWLKRELRASRATWKIIASDMPLGMLIADGKNFEGGANGDGPPLGRELEIADLLRFLKLRRVRNVVWLTADVHHAVSHYYDPSHAQFTEFDPFWEFVSGPLHAGTFGPSALDNTFGPEVRWNSRKQGDPATGPHTPHQFFGTVRIDGTTQALTVTHHNRDGQKLWSTELPAI